MHILREYWDLERWINRWRVNPGQVSRLHAFHSLPRITLPCLRSGVPWGPVNILAVLQCSTQVLPWPWKLVSLSPLHLLTSRSLSTQYSWLLLITFGEMGIVYLSCYNESGNAEYSSSRVDYEPHEGSDHVWNHFVSPFLSPLCCMH